MITKNFVISELLRISTILADVVREWGGKDESQEGKPGKLSLRVIQTLEELPVTWDKDKAEFKLSGIKKLDEKGRGGLKTWVYGDLPGKYKDKDFVLHIYRKEDAYEYSFKSDSKSSQKTSSSSKLLDVFNRFFEVEGAGTDLLSQVHKELLAQKGVISTEIRKYLSPFVKSPISDYKKNTLKSFIYLRYLVPAGDIIEGARVFVSPEDLEKITAFVEDFLSKIEGIDLSKIRVSTTFKENSASGNKDHLLLISIKFI